MTEEFELGGKIALIIGAGKSWLEPVAISLLEAGANVIVINQDKKHMPLGSDLASALNQRLKVISSDLLDYRTLSQIAEQEISNWGKFDILVNSLNVRFAKPLVEISYEEWRKVLDTNLTTIFTACQVVGRHMLRQKAGKIINITTCLGERGVPNCTAYGAAAGGVIQFTRSLALEWVKSGITVNAIALGWIVDSSEIPEERVERYIPMRRYGRPEEFTSLVVYLASSASNYVTGQVYSVDGGAMGHS